MPSHASHRKLAISSWVRGTFIECTGSGVLPHRPGDRHFTFLHCGHVGQSGCVHFGLLQDRQSTRRSLIDRLLICMSENAFRGKGPGSALQNAFARIASETGYLFLGAWYFHRVLGLWGLATPPKR